MKIEMIRFNCIYKVKGDKMENNKVIVGYCPNFDRIIHADFLEDDILSLQLVRIYRDFIFKIDISKSDDIEKVRELDQTMGKYVDDYFFRKTLQREMKSIRIKKSAGDIMWMIVDAIIKIFKQYEEDQTRKIYISRWI